MKLRFIWWERRLRLQGKEADTEWMEHTAFSVHITWLIDGHFKNNVSSLRVFLSINQHIFKKCYKNLLAPKFIPMSVVNKYLERYLT